MSSQPPIRTGLLDFFRNSAGCQFVIPVYQRNYTWTAAKEVDQYLTDMKSVLTGEYKNHFLGIMIYLDSPIDYSAREFSVIDGQQRLTTTFLTLYAVRHLFEMQGDVEGIKKLEGQYLTNPFSSTKLKYKLKPMVSDDEVYQHIVDGTLDDVADKDSNVFKNYLYICKFLEDLAAAGYTANDILIALNKLYVVCVPIGDEDDAQKIFESINATGVKLTASDLIRNYILMKLPSDTQEAFYAQYWKKIEANISADSKKLELFFRMFLAAKNFNLPNKSRVYELFIEWSKSTCWTNEQILQELVKYAKAYYFVYRKPTKELDSGLRPAVTEYRRILSEMPAAILMEFELLYEDGKISEETFSQLISTISIYLIRRALANLDTSGITRLFPSLWKDVYEDCAGDYSNIVEILNKDLIVRHVGDGMYMPDDEQLSEAVMNANMYNIRSTLRIVLDRIELDNNPAPVDLSTLSVEHLMPQTPTTEWLQYLNVTDEVYQKNLHRLGNLTLASKPDNSAMKNKPWDYKKQILQSTSHLKINQDILKKTDWNINEIDSRTKELIAEINRLYPYPKVNMNIVPREAISIDMSGITAQGYLSMDDGSVEIDVGSELVIASDINADIFDQRQELLDDGVIAEDNGKLVFEKPYIFYAKFQNSTALSTTAGLILGGTRNGWSYWKNTEGKALKDVPEIRNKFA